MARLIFDLCIGKTSVQRVVFPQDGRREMRSSNGQVIGHLVLKNGTLRFELHESAVEIIAGAAFYD